MSPSSLDATPLANPFARATGNPCRARKLRCSRSLPCESCQSKGHPELCIWDADSAPPLYEARERNETESLRHEGEEAVSFHRAVPAPLCL